MGPGEYDVTAGSLLQAVGLLFFAFAGYPRNTA
jgi:hypothetical protein